MFFQRQQTERDRKDKRDEVTCSKGPDVWLEPRSPSQGLSHRYVKKQRWRFSLWCHDAQTLHQPNFCFVSVFWLQKWQSCQVQSEDLIDNVRLYNQSLCVLSDSVPLINPGHVAHFLNLLTIPHMDTQCFVDQFFQRMCARSFFGCVKDSWHTGLYLFCFSDNHWRVLGCCWL